MSSSGDNLYTLFILNAQFIYVPVFGLTIPLMLAIKPRAALCSKCIVVVW